MVGAFRSRSVPFAILGLALAPLLGACGGGETVQQALGYEQRGPDEMAVIKRPPLIVPPDYNLRPPRSDDQAVAGEAASETARQTLIGTTGAPESGAAPGGISENGASAASTSRDLLVDGATADDAATSEAASEGQNLLVNRTDRTERELDEVTQTRAQSRVDGALLRRLLAWTPEDRPDAAEGVDGEAEPEAEVVQMVSRSQTILTAEPAPAPASAE